MRAGTWEVIEAFVTENGIPFGPGSRTRPGDPGFHGRGQARDFGGRSHGPGSAIAVSRLFAPIARSHPQLVPEVFGYDGIGVDNGKPYQAPGHTNDHTHVAIGAGVTIEQLRAAAAGRPVDLTGARPASSSGQSITESGLRRFFLIGAGVSLTVWGLALVGLDLRGAITGVAIKRVGRLVK